MGDCQGGCSIEDAFALIRTKAELARWDGTIYSVSDISGDLASLGIVPESIDCGYLLGCRNRMEL